MGRIIALVNQKGGVGKTTSAINIGCALASLGQKVLIVDLDPQGNASSGLGVHERLKDRNLYHVIALGTPIKDMVVSTMKDNLHLVPAAQDLAGAEVELVALTEREWRLFKALQPIKSLYDYILIDCPPSLGLLTINGLAAADAVIVPVQTEYYALEGLSQLLGTIELVREHLKPELEILGALLTLYDRRNRLARQVVEEVRKHFPGPVFDDVIPRSVRLAEAPSFGQSIFDFDAFSKGARAYKSVAKEILDRFPAESRLTDIKVV